MLVIYTLEDTIEQDRALVQSFVNGLYQAMLWVKKTPSTRSTRWWRKSTSQGRTRPR